MKKLVAAGLCLVIGVQVLAMLMPDRRFVLVVVGCRGGPGAARAALVPGARSRTRAGEPPSQRCRRVVAPLAVSNRDVDPWSESTRSDWDRHLRPMLARQFGMATGQKQDKDPDGFCATGRMLFGDELWAWVDPENVARTGGHVPGPGRAALDEILRRLEQV